MENSSQKAKQIRKENSNILQSLSQINPSLKQISEHLVLLNRINLNKENLTYLIEDLIQLITDQNQIYFLKQEQIMQSGSFSQSIGNENQYFAKPQKMIKVPQTLSIEFMKTQVQLIETTLGEVDFEFRALTVLIYKICDVWVASKKIQHALIYIQNNDLIKLQSIVVWLQFFQNSTQGLLKYLPKIVEFQALLQETINKSNLLIESMDIQKQGGNKISLKNDDTALPKLYDLITSYKKESDKNWPQESPNHQDVMQILKLQSQIKYENFRLEDLKKQYSVDALVVDY